MKKLEWDLSNLFKTKDDFYSQIDNVKKMTQDIQSFKNKKIDDKLLLELLNKKYEIKEQSNNILIYGSLCYYKNVNNDECAELKKIAEQTDNEINAKLKFIDGIILDLGRDTIREFLLKNTDLKKYDLYLDNLFRLHEHIQSDEINEQIKDNINLINEQLSSYNTLLKCMEYEDIESDGKKLEVTSANFAKYISSRDRDIRRQAYLSVNNAYSDKKDEFAHILNMIYGLRIKNAELENYNSVLEKVLFEENIDSRIVTSLIKNVHDNLPLIQEYLDLKAYKLEIEDPHLYDFNVPLDNGLKIKYTMEEAVDIIKNALRPLGDKYLEVVERLLDGHIDAEVDDNKHQSITFSWHTYSFMNFRGAYVDLKNMIHEIGHIVNYYLSMKEQPFIYEDSTIFVGETASIVNEILLNKYLYENAQTDDEKIFYLSKEIENYFTSVFKQTMYTEFENELYKIKGKHELTSSLLSEKYASIIKKYYGNKVNYDDVSCIEWARLGHLYRYSYYPYKYATGLLMASVVVNSIVNDNSLSIDDYLKFLVSGSSKYSLDLLKTLHIDLSDDEIMTEGFKVLENDVKELTKVLKK